MSVRDLTTVGLRVIAVGCVLLAIGFVPALVSTIVQELHDIVHEYFVLVLDDHHTVEDQDRVNEFQDLFVTYADEHCHVILSSRMLPALPSLSLLIARQQAAGLSLDELRFSSEEVQALALRNHGIELSARQAGVLAWRTGGWVTGLLLTASPLIASNS